MVRTRRLGKRRPFYRGLLLTIVTFGLYGIYWIYKAPKEIHEQFELVEDGRDDGVLWLVVGLVVPVVIFVYYWKAVANVGYVRDRLGFERSLSPLAFLGLVTAAPIAIGIAVLAAVFATAAAEAFAGLVAVVVLGIGAMVGVQAYGHYRLQEDINELWDAWERRIDELSGEPVAGGTQHPPPTTGTANP